jgi:hypothetical protein
MAPGVNETSQVPHKEPLHVRKVSDCARLHIAKPFQGEDVAFSEANSIGTNYPRHGGRPGAGQNNF